MASIVPKIRVGLAACKREKHNLSFDCSTTANIGSVQPTMCREMIPNSKFKVKVSSLVRLASMPLPTFGRMSLRHYHAFVPYVDLWQPFDAMMSGQHYKGYSSATFIPNKVPYFTMADVLPMIVSFSDISIAPIDSLDQPYRITNTNISAIDGTVYTFGEGDDYDYSTYEEAYKAAQAHDLEYIKTAWDAVRQGTNIFGGSKATQILFDWRPTDIGDPLYDSPDLGFLNLGDFAAKIRGNYGSEYLKIGYSGVADATIFATFGTVITAEGADLITQVGSYYLLFKFKPFLKRLRTIFIGLGYQFSPYNTEELSVLKLLAYYKTWFNLFCPNREHAFIDTDCYWLIKRLSEINGVNVASGVGGVSKWKNFLLSLASECYYYLPMDYFSMAVTRPQQSMQDTDFTLNSGALKVASSGAAPGDNSADNVATYNNPSGAAVAVGATSGTINPLTMKLAFQMLKWANKNTVIGRSVRQYLKVHFGVDDVNPIDDGGVYRVGSSPWGAEQKEKSLKSMM